MSVNRYSYANDGQAFISPHFQIGEFKSYSDDLGYLTSDEILIDENLPIMLEKLYTYLDNLYGVGYIYVSSGYRDYSFEMYLAGFCGFHNQGKAADIICYDSNAQLIQGTLVACAAQEVGFDGIGYIGNAVHVDVRGYKSYFDESRGCMALEDYYGYFGIARPIQPVEQPIAEPPKEEPKIEEPKEEPIIEEPKIEEPSQTENNSPISNETDKPNNDTKEPVSNENEPKNNELDSNIPEYYNKKNNSLLWLIDLLIDLIRKIFNK